LAKQVARVEIDGGKRRIRVQESTFEKGSAPALPLEAAQRKPNDALLHRADVSPLKKSNGVTTRQRPFRRTAPAEMRLFNRRRGTEAAPP
jgi:hypothetical protein